MHGTPADGTLAGDGERAETFPARVARARDRGFAALRRAGRTAIVMPALFALGDEVIGNPELATFAAFGSFAMLLLVDFGGPMRERLQAQAALALAGRVLVCLGTLASRTPGSAAVAMALVGFAVLFAGVVSSVLAGATTSLLLAFILPVVAPRAASRRSRTGWPAGGWPRRRRWSRSRVLWPAPTRDPLRGAGRRPPAGRSRRACAPRPPTCSAAAARASADERDAPIARADAAVAALHGVSSRRRTGPTGLSTRARARWCGWSTSSAG